MSRARSAITDHPEAPDAAAARPPRDRFAGMILLIGGLAAVVLTVLAIVSRDAANYVSGGFTFPGWPTSLAAALLRLAADTAGAITVGTLAYAVLCATPNAAGRLQVTGYGAVTIARRAAAAWAVLTLVLTPVIAANVVGRPIGALVADGTVWSVIGHTLPSRGWLVAGVVAVVVAFAARSVLSWSGTAGVMLLAALGVVAPAVVGNAGEGLGHDIATSAIVMHVLAAAIWLGAAAAGLAEMGRRRAQHRPAMGPSGTRPGTGSGWGVIPTSLRRRLGLLTSGAAAVMAVSGLILGRVLVGPGQLLDTQYGLMAVAKAVLLALAAIALWWWSRRPHRAAGAGAETTGTSDERRHTWSTTFLAAQIALLTVGMGASVAMAQQPAAAFFAASPTPSTQELGFALPDGPSLVTFATIWRVDLIFAVIGLGAAGLYAAGLRRLSRRGDVWPVGRTVAFVAGCALLILARCSGFAAYAEATFSMHMVEHMLLTMVVPALLVLGGPFTLLTRCRPGARRYVDRVMGSWPVRILTHPLGAMVVLALLLFGLYLGPYFGYAIGYHWGHELMDLMFVATGFFLFWQIVGIDPLPRRAGHLVRLGLIVVMMTIDTVFGIIVLTRDTVLGLLFYGYLHLPWRGELLADQHLGALIVWLGGEVPLIPIAIAVLVQWWRADSSAAAATIDPMVGLRGELEDRRGHPQV